MSQPRVTIRQLKTGVPGLDEVLGGGLPEFSFNLRTGAPGSGKTTLANQMMFAMATPARPALYFTVLGESPLKMPRYQQQFDFFDNDAGSGDLEAVFARIVGEVKASAPGIVIFDSFRSMVLSSREEAHGFQGLQ